MTARPGPRKSRLTATPFTQQPTDPEQLTGSAAASAAGSRRTRKASFSWDDELVDRLRGAWAANTTQNGVPIGFSAFAADLMDSALTRFEAEHNEGRPYPPLSPGRIPRGRTPGT